MHAQKKTDHFLQEMLEKNASPQLKNILANPGTYRYQIIYTKIDRNKKNDPLFTNYYCNVDRSEYFNPASTVKMPLAFLALEKLNKLKQNGIDLHTSMLTDSGFAKQTTVHADTTSKDGLPSIAHYIKKIFLVSDNDAYNRLYEFIGQQTINQGLWKKGYKEARITRRFVPMNEEENRHTNPIRFVKNNETLYEQAAAYNEKPFDFIKKILVGKAHYNSDDVLVNEPMDFTTHNNVALEDLQSMLQSVLFPSSVPAKKRFDLSENDYRFLYRYMSMLPSESKYPLYDSSEFFDSYAKFIFKSGRSVIPASIRIFNKPGWSYGFLTDVMYVADFENNVEFMLSATIYVNSDGILNDNKYEYDSIGYPFFKEIGNIIYQHELQRPRKFIPDLSKFKIDYSNEQ